MIKKFIDKLFGKSDSTQPGATRAKKSPFGQRQDVGVKEHGIDVKLVDDRAMDVVHTLKDAGYEAYIVGGAVRDLLVGLRPKDFDVATDATPEQVKSLFRRAFIIGRRFRIVHVIYGRGREHEVIEVSTFRAHLDSSLAEQVGGNERTSKSELAGMKHAVDASGRVLRDNVWGPIEQDAARRDFTINAMYYDPETQVVVDYHNGIKDAKKRIIRMIGSPAVRYREDPVRIIRAVRFAAKLSALGFKFEDKTVAPLREMKGLLADVPQSRLFDEMLKLLQTGHALASIAQLKFLGLGTGIYPLLDVVVENADEPFWCPAYGGPTCAKAGSSAKSAASTSCPRCRTRSMMPSTPRSATFRAAASWAPTCARSGPCSRVLKSAPAAPPIRCSSSRAFAPASTSCACARRPARSRWNLPSGGRSSAPPTTTNATR
jgi:poly(A) polymerase